MFTGIIETVGSIRSLEQRKENIDFLIASDLAPSLRVDQSVAHNGVCLTVTALEEMAYRVTAVKETLVKSNLGLLQIGDLVNLERSLKIGDRLDGHLVQGHVDGTAQCLSIDPAGGSHYFTFNYPKENSSLLIPKGSITVNGVSLTIAELNRDSFSVAIIPYTYTHTNFTALRKGDMVNLEFDLIGKYIQRHILVDKLL